MKTLLVDSFDSFTHNLFQYLAEVIGGNPVVIRNAEMPWHATLILGGDNTVASPGPGRPELEKYFGICQQAILESGLPILCVCLGHLFGGKVRPAPLVNPFYVEGARASVERAEPLKGKLLPNRVVAPLQGQLEEASVTEGCPPVSAKPIRL
jgi:anthranilate/para-aminobenzoate synthase component II